MFSAVGAVGPGATVASGGWRLRSVHAHVEAAGLEEELPVDVSRSKFAAWKSPYRAAGASGLRTPTARVDVAGPEEEHKAVAEQREETPVVARSSESELEGATMERGAAHELERNSKLASWKCRHATFVKKIIGLLIGQSCCSSMDRQRWAAEGSRNLMYTLTLYLERKACVNFSTW